MNEVMFFTESGKLVCRDQGKTAAAFARSAAEGLFALITAPEQEMTPAQQFFRRITTDFLQKILRNDSDPERAMPDENLYAQYERTAPPMAGGGRCSGQDLASLFGELLQHLKQQNDLRQYLTEKVPAWKEIGRITFHLAENRQDPDGRHPFVFLATYPDHTGENGEVRHLPLASALKQYAAAGKETLDHLLSPLRNAAETSPFLAKMLEDRSLFRPCVWTPQQAFLFVRDIPHFQTAGIPVRLNRESGKRPARLKLDITLDAPTPRKGQPVTETILRFSVAAALGDRKLTEEELNAILQTGGGLIRVRGEWVEADTARIKQLLEQWQRAAGLAASAGVPFLHGLRMISGIRMTSEENLLPPAPEGLCEIQAGPGLQELLENGFPETQIPPIPDHIPLRPYQQYGVRWLYRMGELGLGGCLADDMGLGKTIQVLTFLEMLRRRGELDCRPGALAVVPASLLENWNREAAKFTPELKTTVLHPSAGTLAAFRSDPAGFLAEHDLIITSYGMALRLPELAGEEYPVLLLDEAQYIKNPACRQSGVLRKFNARRKFALTGTPLENSVNDLWSIFDFLIPGFLGNYSSFRSAVREMDSGANGYGPLRDLIRPCILRRLKTDRSIIRDLPDKSEIRVNCHLTDVQIKMYHRAVEQFRKELYASEEEHRRGVILSWLMQFKQICNHPGQFSGLGGYGVERSGKFQCLASLAETIAERNDKLLVFTQFREMIQPIHDLLTPVFGRSGLMLHGGTPVPERMRAVADFQSETGAPFFVLSLRAAGVGLTLTAANHVVHFDRWWNPAVENQATDRAYRIGQHRNVLVHKFVCPGTLEERIDAMLKEKSRLSDLFLKDGGEKLLTEMSNEELMSFVQYTLPGD